MKLGWLKRTLKAPARIRTGKGFGVHSPFAYAFITRVLREDLPFYAYSSQKSRYRTVRKNAVHHPFLTLKRIKLLFRTINYFSPESALQIGSDNGLVTSALLDVSSSMKISRYGCDSDFLSSQVKDCRTLSGATSEQIPDIVIVVTENNDDEILPVLFKAVENESVIIFPCIDHNPQISMLWDSVNAAANYGMTFTNDRFGILVAKKKLPRQKCTLWL